MIISSLGAVYARSLEAMRSLLLCNDKEIKKIGRRLSEAIIMGSMEIWRTYARDMPLTEDPQAIRMTAQKVMTANDTRANEQAEEDQEDQELRSGQVNTTDEGSEDQKITDLTNEFDIEPIESEEVNDKHCKEDEEEEAMQEAM
jgi:hypothetical protein